jgi:hypothetical protein
MMQAENTHPVSYTGLQQEICEEDRFTEAPSKCSHEATKSPLRLLQQVLCEEGYSKKVFSKSTILHLICH